MRSGCGSGFRQSHTTPARRDILIFFILHLTYFIRVNYPTFSFLLLAVAVDPTSVNDYAAVHSIPPVYRRCLRATTLYSANRSENIEHFPLLTVWLLVFGVQIFRVFEKRSRRRRPGKDANSSSCQSLLVENAKWRLFPFDPARNREFLTRLANYVILWQRFSTGFHSCPL